MDKIDKDKVELACDDSGCALIPDDGNSHNDILVNKASGIGQEVQAPAKTHDLSQSHKLRNNHDIPTQHDETLLSAAQHDETLLSAAQHNEHEVRLRVNG